MLVADNLPHLTRAIRAGQQWGWLVVGNDR
jgi:hypothetical protein